MIIKFLIGTLLIILLFVLIFHRRNPKMISGKEGFQQFVHERSSINQDQNQAVDLLGTNKQAHFASAVSSSGHMEVVGMPTKMIHDEYSAKYADCQKSDIKNMPNGCVLCINPNSGDVLSKTISGPGSQIDNYFTPCPCPVTNASNIGVIKKALRCEKIRGSFGIIGSSDCSYTYDGPGRNQGYGIHMTGNRPTLEIINEQNTKCKIPFKGIGATGKVMPAKEGASRQSVAKWVNDNYPECDDIDACMEELNESLGTMTQDCAVQIYRLYGDEEGSANPRTRENYNRIMNDGSITRNKNNIPSAYRNYLESKLAEMEEM